MSIKKIHRLEEGPLDYIRGAAGEAGRKIKQTATDIHQAGKDASAQREEQKRQAIIDNLAKEVNLLNMLVIQYDEQKGNPQDENPQGEKSTNQAAADNGQQPHQQQKDNVKQDGQYGGVAKAFQTNNASGSRPKFSAGKDGKLGYTFDSHMRLLHDDQTHLDEGVWDFLRGAGGEVANKARAAVDKFSKRPSMLKDIYHAGVKAHNDADIKNKALAQLKKVVGMISSLGPAGDGAMEQAIAALPQENQRRIKGLLYKSLKKQIEPVVQPTA